MCDRNPWNADILFVIVLYTAEGLVGVLSIYVLLSSYYKWAVQVIFLLDLQSIRSKLDKYDYVPLAAK